MRILLKALIPNVVSKPKAETGMAATIKATEAITIFIAVCLEYNDDGACNNAVRTD